MPHSRDLRAQRMHALEAERAFPPDTILPGAEPVAARTNPPQLVRPKRDNIGERMQALEAAMSDLSPVLADLLAPQSGSGPARCANESPPAKIVELAAARIAGKGAGSQPAATPVHHTSNEAVAAIAMPQQARGRWSPPPEPAILSPAEATRTTVLQTDVLGPKHDNARSVRGALFLALVSPLIPVAFSATFYVLAPGNPAKQTREATVERKATAVAQPAAVPQSAALPLPSSYGVYAISKGELQELEALPFKAPDPRVRLSAEITKPSSTVLPDGKIAFAVFRRELLSGSTQKAAVRVVARIARKMTFENGKAVSMDVQSSWRIRSDSYDLNVAPLGNNPEMVAVRPDSADFALPPGRYALIFGGLAYDFTVGGAVTDRAHCLESIMSANGQVYIECRSP
jgi:hypothetical protein